MAAPQKECTNFDTLGELELSAPCGAHDAPADLKVMQKAGEMNEASFDGFSSDGQQDSTGSEIDVHGIASLSTVCDFDSTATKMKVDCETQCDNTEDSEADEEEQDADDEIQGREKDDSAEKQFVAVPLGIRTPQYSIGAENHGVDECNPCVWFWKSRGCSNEEACAFCHMCPPGMVKQRKQEKIRRLKAERREMHAKLQKQELADSGRQFSAKSKAQAAAVKPGKVQSGTVTSATRAKADPQAEPAYAPMPPGMVPPVTHWVQEQMPRSFPARMQETSRKPSQSAEKAKALEHFDTTCDAVRRVLAARGIRLSKADVYDWLITRPEVDIALTPQNDSAGFSGAAPMALGMHFQSQALLHQPMARDLPSSRVAPPPGLPHAMMLDL